MTIPNEDEMDEFDTELGMGGDEQDNDVLMPAPVISPAQAQGPIKIDMPPWEWAKQSLSPVAPAAPVKRKPTGFHPDIDAAIDEESGRLGLDRNIMRTFTRIESNGNPSMVTGRYKGLMMLSDDEFKRFVPNGDIFNPRDNLRAGGHVLKEKMREFEKRYGRSPSASDLYLMHNQGVGGADAHWNNPESPAWENVARTAEGRQKGPGWAKQAIWGNLPDSEKRRFGSVENVTSRDFTDFWDRRVRELGGEDEPMQLAQAQGPIKLDVPPWEWAKRNQAPQETPASGQAPWEAASPTPAKPAADSKTPPTGFLDSTYNALISGYHSLVQNLHTLSADAAQRELERLDKLPKKEGWVWDAIRDMNGPEEVAKRKALVEEAKKAAAAGIAYRKAEVDLYPLHPSAEKMTQAKTFAEGFNHFLEAPVTVIANIGAQSFPQMVPALFAGAITRNPYVAATLMGGTSGLSEYSSEILDAFVEAGVDPTKPEQVAKAFEDPAKMAEIRDKAFRKGAVVGFFDAASVGIASKTLLPKTALAGSPVLRGAANIGVQMPVQGVMGAAGEGLGSLAAGKEIVPGALMAEFLGEFSSAPFEVAALRKAGKGQPAATPQPETPAGSVELDAAKARVNPAAPRTTPPPLPEETDGPAQPMSIPDAAAPAVAPPTPEEMSVLRRMGYTEVDIRDMEPEQRAAEMEDAKSRGIVPDVPTAEPIADIVAQARDLADPENDRRGLYLSPDNVRQIQENPDFIEEIGNALRSQGELVPNVDGNGGVLLAKDAATAKAVRAAIESGQDIQQILGQLTGAGTGKRPDASAVVQQVTPEGAVTRETAVPAAEVAAAEQELAAKGRDTRVVTPEQALARREQEIAEPTVGDGSRQAPVKVASPMDIARAEQRVVEPTEAQKEAGNYSKGHLKFQGLDITIENPKGSIRRGTSPDGTPWEVVVPATYGYVKRSVGRDGDQVDVYVGQNPKSDRVFIIDQVDPDTGKFDEHKAMLGYNTRSGVRFDYEQAFSDGRGGERIGGITEMPMDQFKDWLSKGKRTRPVSKLDEKPDAVAAQPTETSAEQADKLPDNLTDAERETLVKAWRYVNAIEQARAQGRDIQQKRLDIANELDADLASYGIEFDSFANEQSLREYLGRSRGTDQAGDAGIKAPQAAEDTEAAAPARSGRPGSPEAPVVQREQEDRGREGDGTGQRAAEVERPKRYEGDNLTDDDVDTIVEQWKYVREVANRPKPQSLAAYVIAQGGIKDDAREVRHIAGAAKERPGLINKDGWNLDDIALSAWEAGFMGDMNERPTIADFLDRLQDDLHTGTVVRTNDEPMLDDIRIANEIARELADYGVTTNRFRSEATLREYFGQERPATARQAARDEEAEPAAEERTGQARPDQDEVVLPPDEAPETGPSDSGITTEKSGQTSLVPEPTTKEKIAAEAKKKGDRGKANADLDAGELFNPDAGKQTDLVDMAKAAKADPYITGKDVARDHVLTRGRAANLEFGMMVLADGTTKENKQTANNTKSFLEVSEETAPELYFGEPKSVDFHHNHPKSTSLSRSDYTHAAPRKALRRTWVHGHDGSEYWASLNADADALGAAFDIAQKATDSLEVRRTIGKAEGHFRYAGHMRALMMRDAGIIDYGATLAPADAAERVKAFRDAIGPSKWKATVASIKEIVDGLHDRRPGDQRTDEGVGGSPASAPETGSKPAGSEAVGERGETQDRGETRGEVEPQFQAEAELESLIDDVITKQFARKGKETAGPIKIGSGDILRSKSGRELSPAPKVDATTSGRATNTIKRMNAWLHSEAIKEVDARPSGRRDILRNDVDKSFFQDTLKAIDPKKATKADQDTLNDILFGSPEGPTEGNLVKRGGENPSARKAAKAAGSAARNVIKGMDDVATGLATLFGAKSNRVGSGPSFDEDTYRKAVPFFKSGISHFSKAGADIKTAVRELVSYLADTAGMSKGTILDMKPYLVRFVRDIQTGVIDPAKGDENAPDSRQGVERDRGTGRSEDSLGQARVPDERVQDGAGTQPRDGRPGKDAVPARGGSVPDGDAAAVGTGRDRGVPGTASGNERSPAGSDRGGRGSDAGVEGVPAGRVAAEAVSGTARRAPSLKEALAAQKEADATVPFELNDPDNIRAALPALKPPQQDDVVKAEARFSQPEGHGFLLTNGTGTGKTWSGLGVVKRFVKQGKSNILIVAPSQGILDNWISTGRMLGVDITRLPDTKTAGKGVVATTYANLGDNETLADRNWDLIVADEAHKLSQNEAGSPTDALHVLRGLTNKDPYGRARMKLAPDLAKLKELEAAAKANQSLRKKYEEANTAYFQKVSDLRDELAKEPRAKALFLSATPFAYRKSTDYAEGFLFDYPELTGRYNSPGGQSEFLQRNFGYAIRYNRAEEPGPEVNVGVLEREFYERLKREGVLSGRRLEVEADYDRRFVLVDDAVGAKIDQAMTWLSSEKKGRYLPLFEKIHETFNYLAQRRLLEAIKAKHVVPRIKRDLELGRKVVVFHDYNEGGGFAPFAPPSNPNERVRPAYGEKEGPTIGELYSEFIKANPYVKTLDFAQFRSPIDTLTKAFPEALVYNGRIPNKQRARARDEFNLDGSGRDIIIVQSAAGEAGISLHDTTGKHQRVLYNLGLPTRPTTAIQQEGRIYREGQVSDAILRYMSTGTGWERTAFSQTIAERASTAENLALGDEARALRDAFIDAFNDADDIPQGADEGRGGKAKDRTMAGAVSPYEKAKAFYFGEGKKRGRRDQREGADYYATPEPIGLKMVEFADVQIGERILEPSAGHGAIARWFPEGANRVLIEPSSSLASRAGLASPGAKVITSRFEDHYIGNKYDAIVMNPPFGAGGKDAIDHIQKAVGHLREGGRVVAILPRGPAADKRLEAFRDNDANKNIYSALEIDLPPVMFERAGTKVATRLVVFERHSEPSTAPQTAYRDLSDAETINELFDRMENLSLSARKRENQSPAGQVPADVVEPPRQTVVPATAEVSFKLGETKHSRTGADLYVASIAKQVPRATFDNILAAAKKHKGYYSSFRGSGAIPGFQFPTEEDRTAFLQAINGGMREEADQEDFPRVNKEGYILALPYEKEWGNPRFIKADRERAIARLREIQSINADEAPWADLVQAKRDIDQIVTNLFYWDPKTVEEWSDPDKRDASTPLTTNGEPSSADIWLYLSETDNPEMIARDDLRKSLFSNKDVPAELAEFADEGGQAIDSLLDSRRKGLRELLKFDDEVDPVKPKTEKPVGAIGDKMPSGFYFKAARKIDEARETLFQMSGQSVINWLMKQGVSRAEINHFRLWEKFGGTAKFTRDEFKRAIGERMFDFRRKMSWLNPERSKRDYEMGGTRAFTGPRVPGQGIYFERPIAFPKRLAGGSQFAPGQFESPHWYDVLKNAWASWRGSIREVPGYGKMLVGEEGQSDYMQGASTGRRPKITEAEWIQHKMDSKAYDKVMARAFELVKDATGHELSDTTREYWVSLAPDYRSAELDFDAWLAKLNELRDYAQSTRNSDGSIDHRYIARKLRVIDNLEQLRRENEKFFAPGALAKYRQSDLSKRTPESPIDENYVRVMARDLLLLAAEKNVDSISVSTSSTTARIQNNPRAAHFYDQQMKPALERELRKLTGQWDLSLQKVALPKAMGSPKSERPYTVWAAKLEPATLEKIKQEGVSVFSIGERPSRTISQYDYVKGRLMFRQPVDLSNDAERILDIMRETPSALPGMIPEAVITKLTPIKGTSKYTVTALDLYGEEHTYEDDAAKIIRTQGHYLLPHGRPLVVLSPIDFGGDLVKTTRTVRAHETVHALRLNGFLPGGNRDLGTTWGRLVGHADVLGVLHMSRHDLYKRLGDPKQETASKTTSTFEVYTTLYGGLDKATALELYHQEAVAHMMEVYVAGGWTDQEIAPVKAVLDDILSGKTAQWSDVSEMPLSAGMLRSIRDQEISIMDRVRALYLGLRYQGDAILPGNVPGQLNARGAVPVSDIEPIDLTDVKVDGTREKAGAVSESAGQLRRDVLRQIRALRDARRQLDQEAWTPETRLLAQKIKEHLKRSRDALSALDDIIADEAELVELSIDVASGSVANDAARDRYSETVARQRKSLFNVIDGGRSDDDSDIIRSIRDVDAPMEIGTDRVHSLQDAISGQSMRRDLDNLGFYSKALEAARALKQEKGTPEQMLAQLKKAGVKDAEIEATGLGKLFASKTRQPAQHPEGTRMRDVSISDSYKGENFGQKVLERNGRPIVVADVSTMRGEVNVRNIESVERRRGAATALVDDLFREFPDRKITISDMTEDGSKFFRSKYDLLKDGEIRRKTQSISKSEIVKHLEENRVGLREVVRDETLRAKDKGFATKWSNYSLDPSNPTFRETVIHLPANDKDFADSVKARHVDPADAESDFYSGHFPEPNIIGHMMTSMTRHEGKAVYTIDQIQSDWGQKLRDGGVRDEAKIAELKRARDAALEKSRAAMSIREIQDEAIRKFANKHGRVEYGRYDRAMTQIEVDSPNAEIRSLAKEMNKKWEQAVVGEQNAAAEVRRINAELATAEAIPSGHPLVNTTDQWTQTTLRRAIRQAVEAGAEYIAVPSGDVVLTYNPGDANGMRGFYGARDAEGIVPKNLRKILASIDKGTPAPTKVKTLQSPAGTELPTKQKAFSDERGTVINPAAGFTLFPLTDKVRQSVMEDGQPMFSMVPSVGLSPASPDVAKAEIAKAFANVANDEANVQYRSGALQVAGFVGDWVVPSEGQSVTATSLYEAYLEWVEDLKGEPMPLSAFTAALNDLGLTKQKIAGRIRYIGVRVLPDEERPAPRRPTVNPTPASSINQANAQAIYEATNNGRSVLSAIRGLISRLVSMVHTKRDPAAIERLVQARALERAVANENDPNGKVIKNVISMFSLAPSAKTAAPADTRNIARDITDAIGIITRMTGQDAVQVELRDQISGLEANPAQLAASRAAGFDTRTAGGLYNRPTLDAKALIVLATNDPAYDLRTTAGHEAFHHVEEVLANPAEKRLLTSDSEMRRMRALASDELQLSPIDPRLVRMQDKEIRAIAFQRYRRMREEGLADASRLHIGVRRLFDRIVQIFQGVRNVLKGYGYDSYEAIFERARTGQMADPVARRASDRPVRTLRNLIDPQMRPEGYIDREPFDLKDVRLVGRSMASVPLSDIQTIQKSVSVKAVRSKLGLPESDDGRPVSVFKYGDRYYVNDGNHRIEAMRARGAKSIRAEVIEIAPKDGDAQVLADRGPADVPAQPVGAQEDNQSAQAGLSDSDVQASLIPAVAKVYTARWLRRLQPHTDRVRVYLQDKVLPVRRQEEAIEAASGIKLPEHLSVYTAEAIYHGRAGERLTDLQEQHVEPLIQHVRKSNISFAELGDYLYARHAIERNEAIRQIDPTNDAGSGMTDAEAQGIVGMIEQGSRAQAFKTAAGMIDAMVKDARDTLYRAGNLTKEQYDNWTTKYKSYVPLRGFEGEVEEFGIPRVGRGMDIRGPESMQALGRRSKADNPAAYVIQQSVQAIIRSEKNRVDKTLYRLIQAHPDPDVWRVFKGEAKRRINPATGLVEMYWVPPAFAARNKDNVFGVKIAGKQHYMEILHEPLARSLRTAQPGLMGTSIGRAFYSLSRFYAQLVTSFNPEFVISNYLRDIQTALMNVGDVANAPPDVRKRIRNEALSLKSIRGVMAALQSHEGRTIFGGQRAADENMLGRKRSKEAQDYAKWFEEYRLAGGKISFIEMNDIDRIKNRVEKSIAEGKTRRALRNVFDLIDNANSAVENGVRLSAYIALRKNGVSQDKAAFAARELTVNFNRKGELGPGINAFYLFFNASVQGTTRLAQALTRSPAVRKGAATIVLAGVLLDLLNYAISGKDDDDENAYEKIDEWKKEKNMIVMLPGRKDYVQIPMPYGYNVLYLAGQKMAALSRTAAGHGKEKPGKAIAGLLGAMVESFSPMGAAPSWLQMASPTLLDPFTQIAENKSWFGGKIAPEKLPNQKHKPDSEMFYSTAPAWAIDLARALNKMTGGSKVESGYIDVSPESIEHMADFLLGGVGKFIGNIWNTGQRAYNDQEWIPEKTPFLRRVYGKATTESRRRDFYDKWNEVDAAHWKFEDLRKARDFDGMKVVREKNPAELAAYEAMRNTQRQISALRKQADVINLDRTINAVEKEKRLKTLTDRENEIILRALKNYNRLKKDLTPRD